LPAFLQECLILLVVVGQPLGSKSAQTCVLCLLHCLVHRDQQADHLSSPGLLLFVQTRQFPQVMDVTEGMMTQILPVGAPAIMDRDASKGGHDPNGIESIGPSFVMDRIMSQGGGCCDMHPQAFSHDMQT